MFLDKFIEGLDELVEDFEDELSPDEMIEALEAKIASLKEGNGDDEIGGHGSLSPDV